MQDAHTLDTVTLSRDHGPCGTPEHPQPGSSVQNTQRRDGY